MERIYLVDAYALIYRSYYAFIGRPMKNRSGVNTSAIFGFTKFLRDIIMKERPTYLGVAFDPKGGTFRNELYPLYKANRAETPEDIIVAVPYIKKILAAMRIPCIEVKGYEADDVIGTLSVKAAREGYEVFMVTPDKDFGQLIQPHVKIYKQRKSGDGVEIVGCEQLKEQYGIDDPRLIIDILALWGDASDNIPGVPGIGEKGAAKLVCEFGTVENILAKIDLLKGRQKENIIAGSEQLLLSKRLATIETDAPVDFVPAELVMENPDCEALREIYKELDFNMFIREMDGGYTSPFNRVVTHGRAAQGAVSGIQSAAGGGIQSAAGISVKTDAAKTGTVQVCAETDNMPSVGTSAAPNAITGTGTSAGDRFAAVTAPDNIPAREQQADTAHEGTPAAADNIQRDLFGEPVGAADKSGAMAKKSAKTTAGESGISENLFDNPAADYDTIATVPHDYKTVVTQQQLAELAEILAQSDEFCFDVETSGFDFFSDRIVGISFSIMEGEAYYVPLEIPRTAGAESLSVKTISEHGSNIETIGPLSETENPAGSPKDRPMDRAHILDTLKPLFENPAIAKCGQNLKFDIMMLAQAGVRVEGLLYDTMIMHYLLDPESRHGMNHLARLYLGYSPIEIQTLIGRGSAQLTMDRVPLDIVAEYGAEDADITLRLKNILWTQVVGMGLEGLYRKIEEPLIRVLAAMETSGVKIDSAQLHDYGQTLGVELRGMEEQIREMASSPALNVNSSRQLGEVLFEKMKIDPKPKRTKTRQYSTDEEYLQSLADRHPIVNLILEYRGLKKLLSTYIDALPLLVNPKTGHVHTSFNQTVTSTGRLSSTNPNLQNIPIRDAQGRLIRKAFIPSDKERLLLSADYSQVELRLMAHLSGDENLIGAFRDGKDIHAATAARLFGIPLDEVTPEQRRRAKTANFGIIYGISAFGLKQRMGNISMEEARQIIDGYFRSYPRVKEYMERVVDEARDNGYVETIFGRRRYLPDIRSGNSVVRSLAERNAINAPIQGSAADIIKLAMNRVHEQFRTRRLRSELILQVHDELVVDMLVAEQEQVIAIVVDAMENAADLSVRLVADWGTGGNWLEAH